MADTKKRLPSTNLSLLYGTNQSFDPGMGTLGGVSRASSTLFEGQESNNLSNGYQVDHFQSASNMQTI